MIIDIDIKIADGDGNLLHRLEKHIDKFDYTNEKINFNLDMGKNFEYFLSEYMSYSGRVIREKLIHTGENPLLLNMVGPNDMEQEMNRSKESRNQMSEHEVEYRISIGKSHVFTGKFPFEHPAPIRTLEDDLNSYDIDNYEENWNITSAMTRAIEKYESNFYLINSQNDHEEKAYITVMGLDE